MIAVLAIIWNVETGIVVLVAWALLYFLHSWYTRTGRARWLRCTAAVCAIPAGFFLAWQSVSIINQVLLGNWERMSLRDFVFPLFTSYISAIHQAPLDFSTFHWVAAAIFLLLCLFIGLRDFVLGHSSPRRLLVTYLSALALMDAMYFFNRPAYENLRTSIYCPALFLILLLMDHAGTAFRAPGRTVREELKAGIFAGHMYGFSVLLVLAIAIFPHVAVLQRGYQDTSNMDCIPRALEEAGVPYDTILYTGFASSINLNSDKYNCSVLGPSNTNPTANFLLGQRLLTETPPFMINKDFNGCDDPVTAYKVMGDIFASLVGKTPSWSDLYEPPREISVRMKDASRDDTAVFYLFMPRK